MGSFHWGCRCGSRGILADSRVKWRSDRFQSALGYQRWRRARPDHAVEHMRSCVARPKAIDCLEPRKRRTGNAHASGSRAPDALELFDRAYILLALISYALLHGRRQPLSVPEHCRALTSHQGILWRPRKATTSSSSKKECPLRRGPKVSRSKTRLAR